MKIYLKTAKETEEIASILIRSGYTVRIGADKNKKSDLFASKYYVQFDIEFEKENSEV